MSGDGGGGGGSPKVALDWRAIEGQDGVGADILDVLAHQPEAGAFGSTVRERAAVVDATASNPAAASPGTASPSQVDPTKYAHLGGGGTGCPACGKRVYPAEEMRVDDALYHRACFKCAECRAVLSSSIYFWGDQRLLCQRHHEEWQRNSGGGGGGGDGGSGGSSPYYVPPSRQHFNTPERSGRGDSASPSQGQRSPSAAATTTPTRDYSHLGGGSTVCAVCTKRVYANEERRVRDVHVVHKLCRKCGVCSALFVGDMFEVVVAAAPAAAAEGSGDGQSSPTISLLCPKHAAAGGAGGPGSPSAVSSRPSGPPVDDGVVDDLLDGMDPAEWEALAAELGLDQPSATSSATPVAASSAGQATAGAAAAPHSVWAAVAETGGSVKDRARAASAVVRANDEPASPAVASTDRASPARDLSHLGGGADRCAACSKRVYDGEEVEAGGQTFHRACLRCSECAKTLKADKACFHEGEPYCGRHFRKIGQP